MCRERVVSRGERCCGLWGRVGKQKRVPSLWAEGKRIRSLPVGLQKRSRDAGCGAGEGLAGNCGSREPRGGGAEGMELSEEGEEGGCRWHLAVGRSGDSPWGQLLAGASLLRLAVPGAVSLQPKGRGEGWRGQPVLPVANSPSFLLDIAASVCMCVCGGGGGGGVVVVAALASSSLPLPGSSRQSPRLAGLLGFLEGSMPLGGTKKLR